MSGICTRNCPVLTDTVTESTGRGLRCLKAFRTDLACSLWVVGRAVDVGEASVTRVIETSGPGQHLLFLSALAKLGPHAREISSTAHATTCVCNLRFSVVVLLTVSIQGLQVRFSSNQYRHGTSPGQVVFIQATLSDSHAMQRFTVYRAPTAQPAYTPTPALDPYQAQQDMQNVVQISATVALFLTFLLITYGVYWYDGGVVLLAFLVVVPIVLLLCLPPAAGAVDTVPSAAQWGGAYRYASFAPGYGYARDFPAPPQHCRLVFQGMRPIYTRPDYDTGLV
eukprot:2345052-Rhodomonas_salina.3